MWFNIILILFAVKSVTNNNEKIIDNLNCYVTLWKKIV